MAPVGGSIAAPTVTGKRKEFSGRIDLRTDSALEGLGNRLAATDEVVIEATGNSMSVLRVLSRFAARATPR
jgi:transposase